jgi:hypothetical protein
LVVVVAWFRDRARSGHLRLLLERLLLERLLLERLLLERLLLERPLANE